MSNKKLIFLLIAVIGLYIYLLPAGNIALPLEKMEIASAVGLDVIKGPNGQDVYSVPMSSYTFKEGERSGIIMITGVGDNLPETRAQRQLEANRKYIFGLEKIFLYSEKVARKGLEPTIDTYFGNQFINDMSLTAVTEGSSYDMLATKVDAFPSAADYIEGLIQNAREYNFFSDNFKLIDIYVRVGAEGRSLVLPYIHFQNKKPEIAGMAIFKGAKMVHRLDINDTRLMNLLREDKVKGSLTVQKDFKRYASIFTHSRRKASVEKIGDKYHFTIELNLKGDMITNTLYYDMESDIRQITKFEEDLAKQTEKQCEEFIEKMKNELKVDCLNLGWVAVAKYGRGTKTNWDEVVCNSDIDVKIKIKVDKIGRGHYYDQGNVKD